MKKLFSVIGFILMLLFAGNAFAAGASTAISSDELYLNKDNRSPSMRIVTIAFTADDGTAAISDLTLNSDTTGIVHGELLGWFLYRVESIGALASGTEVTDDTDVYLYLKSGGVTKALDLLDGNGVDKLDDDTNYMIYPAINGMAALQLVTNDMTLDINNNAVNSATGYIILVFLGRN